MRIVFYTNAGFASSPLFRYLYAHVAAVYEDVHVVAVRPGRQRRSEQLRRYWRKLRRLGWWSALEILTSQPIAAYYERRDKGRIEALFAARPAPAVAPDPEQVVWVDSVNGPNAVTALQALRPDVIVQAGAGILKPQIFTIARVGTLNLHHGIAPAIRGMQSIPWALWEQRPEWLGLTVHFIDEGLDTGQVLAYAPVQRRSADDDVPALYVRASCDGTARLIEVLRRLEQGETWTVSPAAEGQVYRSTFSGWKRFFLEGRLRRQAMPRRAPGSTQ